MRFIAVLFLLQQNSLLVEVIIWFVAEYCLVIMKFYVDGVILIFSWFTDFLVSAAVAEFKGPDIFGVVRLAQVNMELARIEANFSGLPPGKHGWSINEFGDVTEGAASTGKVFNPSKEEANEVCFDINLLSDIYVCFDFPCISN